MRKTEKHTNYTIDEKNNIVREYLDGKVGYTKISRKYDLSGSGTLSKWVKQYREHGTVFDNRGKSNTGKGNFTLRKKLIPQEMSKDELIKYVEATEDIKKLMAYLNKQKKSIR